MYLSELSDAWCFWNSPQELERPSLELDILNTERTQKVRDLAGHCRTLRDISVAISQTDTCNACTSNALPHSGFGNGSQWKDPSWRVPTSVQQPLQNLVPFLVYLTCKLPAENSLRYATSMRPKKQEQKDWDQSAVSSTFAAGGKLGP